MNNVKAKPKHLSPAVILGIALIIIVFSGWLWCWHYQPVACGNLTLSMGRTDGTAGTLYKHAIITNNGSQSCTLSGYPTASLLSSNGTQLGNSAAPNPLYVVTSVALAHGQQANVVLGFPEAANFPSPSTCSSASTKLKLLLPGSATILTTALVENSCPGFSVTAIQPGT